MKTLLQKMMTSTSEKYSFTFFILEQPELLNKRVNWSASAELKRSQIWEDRMVAICISELNAAILNQTFGRAADYLVKTKILNWGLPRSSYFLVGYTCGVEQRW